MTTVSDRIPGSSYDNPIWHRGWRIYLSGIDLFAGNDWAYQHDDFDGADDVGDSRSGYAPSVENAKAAIDEYEDEEEH